MREGHDFRRAARAAPIQVPSYVPNQVLRFTPLFSAIPLRDKDDRANRESDVPPKGAAKAPQVTLPFLRDLRHNQKDQGPNRT